MTANGTTIYRAIPTEAWPGEASLEVAHVWFRKGNWKGPFSIGDSPVKGITSQLEPPGKISGKPFPLAANAGKSFVGSYVLGMGFVLEKQEAQLLLEKDPRNREVLFPYLIGEDFNSSWEQSPDRWVINFHDWPIEKARQYPDCFEIIEGRVKPVRTRRNEDGEYQLRYPLYERWWQYADKRPELYKTIAGGERVLVRTQTSRTQVGAFVSPGWVYGHKLIIFSITSHGAAALLDSSLHYWWMISRGSTMRTDPVYTPSDCFETFPFPTTLVPLDSIGERYDGHRRAIMRARQEGLTDTYNRLHSPHETSSDISELRILHTELDCAVAASYDWTDLDLGHGFQETKQGVRYTISEAARREVLDRLLALNHERYAREQADLLSAPKSKSKSRKRVPQQTGLF
jgi:hypothetical protein